MDLIKKSIITKTFVYLLIEVLFLVLADIFLAPILPLTYRLYGHAAVVVVFFIVAFVVIYYLIHKPLNVIFREMKALLTGHSYRRIFTTRIDEIGVLAHFFNDVTRNIERIFVDVEEGKRMSKELDIARELEKKMRLKTIPNVSGLAIAGNTRPASEIGGDTFDINTFGNNVFLYAGDVTGHGLPAALIMVMANTIMRTLCEVHSSGYDIIVNTNRILKERIEPKHFMTCVLMRWNLQEQKLYYTGAGHEHIIIFRKKQRLCEVKQTGGIALGMVADISRIVKEEQIPLEEGDMVVLYSDGIIEAKNIRGEQFGIERLRKAVEKYAPVSTPDELFARVSNDFGLFASEQMQDDDITLLAIQKK